MTIYTEYDLKSVFPKKRSPQFHKGEGGRVLILAGREGYWGSGVLAASSAFRMGCGYVYWASFENPSSQIQAVPEVLTLEISGELRFSDYDAILIGPGLGIREEVQVLLEAAKVNNRVVLDADALSVLASDADIELPQEWIITPHPGEMARLLQKTNEEIQANRLSSLKEAYEKYHCHILLKGHPSLVHTHEGVVEIPAGNSGLSKAGSGDVLSGFIVSLLAQGLKPSEALCAAAFVHGRLSEVWAENYSERTLLPSDLKDVLPVYLKSLEI